MRIERSMRARVRALCWISGFVLGADFGCAGKLDDKARFLVDAAGLDAAGADGNGKTTDDAGADEDSGHAGGACGDVVARIFVPSCGGTGCHSAKAPQQGLDLVSSGVAKRVVGVTGKGCNITLADPKDPAGSLLYQKLLPKPPCGSQMPLARPPLSKADVACVRTWIAAQ